MEAPPVLADLATPVALYGVNYSWFPLVEFPEFGSSIRDLACRSCSFIGEMFINLMVCLSISLRLFLIVFVGFRAFKSAKLADLNFGRNEVVYGVLVENSKPLNS